MIEVIFWYWHSIHIHFLHADTRAPGGNGGVRHAGFHESTGSSFKCLSMAFDAIMEEGGENRKMSVPSGRQMAGGWL